LTQSSTVSYAFSCHTIDTCGEEQDVVGGRDGTDALIAEVECYNPMLNVWTLVSLASLSTTPTFTANGTTTIAPSTPPTMGKARGRAEDGGGAYARLDSIIITRIRSIARC
jgi:hypothetical protein